jgi:anaerobic carbon-monoxide dehydrogenase iron sulfur subunit
MKTIFVDLERCTGCKSCEIACALQRSSLSKRLPEALYEPVLPVARVTVIPTGLDRGFPIQCRHCEDAPCLDACPSGALSRDSEGLVLTHDERCIGCWMCVMVCPFGAVQPFRGSKQIIKCDQCKGMDAPHCVESCPTHCLQLLDPDEIARKGRERQKRRSLTALNFVSAKGDLEP